MQVVYPGGCDGALRFHSADAKARLARDYDARLARDYDVCALSLQLGGLQGVVYTRLSAQVYLERADFEELAVLVPKILREIQAEK
ncbi:hypothetical protein T484DRAFT_1797319 [Baffinella frigidus]|nr:hypothetical protein T484DRAFT_1797319 [Cryptophyta sp. CCMP2293]